MKKILLACLLFVLCSSGIKAQGTQFYDSTKFVLMNKTIPQYGTQPVTFNKNEYMIYEADPIKDPGHILIAKKFNKLEICYDFYRADVTVPSSTDAGDLVKKLAAIFNKISSGGSGGSGGDASAANQTTQINNQTTQIAVEKAIYTRGDSIRLGTGNTLYANNTNILRLQRAVDSLKTNVIGSYGQMLDVLRLQRAVDSLKANITIANTAFTANAGTNLNTSALATIQTNQYIQRAIDSLKGNITALPLPALASTSTNQSTQIAVEKAIYTRADSIRLGTGNTLYASNTNILRLQRAVDSLKTNVIGSYGGMLDVLRLQRAVDSLKANITIANTAFTANAGTNLNTSTLATDSALTTMKVMQSKQLSKESSLAGRFVSNAASDTALTTMKSMQSKQFNKESSLAGRFVSNAASDSSLTTIKTQLAQLKANSAPQANIFKTVSTNNAGNTDIWIPTTEKKFRLLAYQIQVTPDAAYTPVGGSLNISLSDNGTIMPFILSTAVPGSIPANLGNTDMTGWVTLGGGFLSAATNNHLQINLSQGLNNGQVTVIVAGTEE